MTTGRLVSVCGAIGVSSSASTDGCTISPPAARLYAVDPVALAMMRPSALTQVTKRPLTETDNSIMRDRAPLVNTTSFSTTRVSSGLPRSDAVAASIRRSS